MQSFPLWSCRKLAQLTRAGKQLEEAEAASSQVIQLGLEWHRNHQKGCGFPISTCRSQSGSNRVSSSCLPARVNCASFLHDQSGNDCNICSRCYDCLKFTGRPSWFSGVPNLVHKSMVGRVWITSKPVHLRRPARPRGGNGIRRHAEIHRTPDAYCAGQCGDHHCCRASHHLVLRSNHDHHRKYLNQFRFLFG